jgi:circadian clock protein KaiC
VAHALREMGVTAVMTAERADEYGDIARHGVEGFVADNVVILRNVLEDHLIRLKDLMEEFEPDRVAVDSLTALERVSTLKSFRVFVIGLTDFSKTAEVAGLFTATTATHISTITDSIVLLRYVEVLGEMRRGLTVLKMRGSTHDKDIRQFNIDGTGMHIGSPYRSISGILSGNFVHVPQSELDRIDGMFTDDVSGGRGAARGR